MKSFGWGLRRTRLLAFGAMLMAIALVAAACGGDDPTAAPTTAPEPTATNAPGQTPEPTARPTAVPTAVPVDLGDQTIRITVGYAPGGGFDTFARIFAAHLGRSTGGHVVVTNLPGANTLVAAKSVTDKDYKEGFVDIVLVIGSLIQDAILNPGGEFEVSDLVYLGLPDFTVSDQTWCVRTSVLDNPEDALNEFFNSGKKYTLAQIGQIDTYAVATKWGTLQDFPWEPVFGYTGTSDMNAAFNRGEVEITPTCRDSEITLNPEWATGYSVPLFYTVGKPQWIADGQAEGKWPWVTAYTEIAQEYKDTPDEWVTGVNALLELSGGTRTFAMPKQTPDDVVAAVRAAFSDLVGSDAFVADMNSRNYDVGLLAGDDYQAVVDNFASLPESTLGIVRQLFPATQ